MTYTVAEMAHTATPAPRRPLSVGKKGSRRLAEATGMTETTLAAGMRNVELDATTTADECRTRATGVT